MGELNEIGNVIWRRIDRPDQIQNDLSWTYDGDQSTLAVTGEAFKALERSKELDMPFFKMVLKRAQIFARMSPNDKALLVKSIQDVL